MVSAVLHAFRAVPFVSGCSEGTEGKECKIICLGELHQHGAWAALELWEDSLHVPRQVVTEITCPGLSPHKYTVQMLKMYRDYLPVSQRLLFNVHWISISPWSGHKYPKQWVIFNLSWAIIPHDLLSWSVSSYADTLLPSLTSLCVSALCRSKLL